MTKLTRAFNTFFKETESEDDGYDAAYCDVPNDIQTTTPNQEETTDLGSVTVITNVYYEP